MTCFLCKFPLVKFKNGRKAKGVCLSCEKQMSKISFEKQEDNYCNLLQNTYSDNPVLSDDIQHNKYYSEYKKFDVNKNTTTNTKPKSSNKKNTDASQHIPLIELNMSMPNLFDLVDLDEEI